MLATLASCPPLVVALLALDVAVLLHALWRDDQRSESHQPVLGDTFEVVMAAVVAVAGPAVLALLGSLTTWVAGAERSVWHHLAAIVTGLLPTALASWSLVPLRHRDRTSLRVVRVGWLLALAGGAALTWFTLTATGGASWRLLPAALLALVPQALVAHLTLGSPDHRFDLTGHWQDHRVGGLWLHVPPGTPPGLGQQLAERAHRALLAIEEQLETRCKGPVRLYLFADRKGLHEGTRDRSRDFIGVAFRRSAALTLGTWEEVGGTIVHELTHVVLRARLGRFPWALLNEGLAEYLRRDIHGPSERHDARPRPAVRSPLYQLARDSAFLDLPPGRQRHDELYEHALSLVSYLLTIGDRRQLLALLAHPIEPDGQSPGQGLDQAVQATYGLTLAELETRWQQDDTPAYRAPRGADAVRRYQLP